MRRHGQRRPEPGRTRLVTGAGAHVERRPRDLGLLWQPSIVDRRAHVQGPASRGPHQHQLVEPLARRHAQQLQCLAVRLDARRADSVGTRAGRRGIWRVLLLAERRRHSRGGPGVRRHAGAVVRAARAGARAVQPPRRSLWAVPGGPITSSCSHSSASRCAHSMSGMGSEALAASWRRRSGRRLVLVHADAARVRAAAATRVTVLPVAA